MNEMKKYLLLFMVTSVAFPINAQVESWDPDWDGDNNVGVSDLLGLLSVFGNYDVDNDGIWDSQDDCVEDECGVCDGGGIPDGYCTCSLMIDALGECGGDCAIDLDGDGVCDEYYGPCHDLETVAFDGYTYDLVEIGDQCWFAENLRTEHYSNGDDIPANLSPGEWISTTSGAVAVYGEDAYCNNYSPDGDACDPVWSLNEFGRLYNFYAVFDERGLCPAGWHVPASVEWTVMTDFLSGTSVAGDKMKTTYGWYSGGNGTNSSGFSGLPGGLRSYSSGQFGLAGYSGLWWSSSTSWIAGYKQRLTHNDAGVNGGPDHPNMGFSVRCLRNEPPGVNTALSSSVAETAATLNGSITFNGGSSVTSTGFKWGYQTDLSDGIEVSGEIIGDYFSVDLTDLNANSTIYFSAFATNAHGTSHGDTLSRCLMQCDPVEFDGYTYETMAIDCQCWFAENLRSDNYADGSSIPGGLDNENWSTTTEGAQAIFNPWDSITNYEYYGRLYNWFAVNNVAGLCPTGWHVPTDDEFTALSDFLGGAEVAGEKMKSSASDWPSWDGSNSSGWSGLPGGSRLIDGYYGEGGYWWSSSQSGSFAWFRHLNSDAATVVRFIDFRNQGFSVRCIKDSE